MMTKEQIMEADLETFSVSELKNALKVMKKAKKKHLEGLQDAINNRGYEPDASFDWKDELENINELIYYIECFIDDKE